MKNILIALFLLFPAHLFSQEFSCSNADIEDAFRLAVQTVDINTRRGILAAGADYGGEWTRDIAINSWNGVSLLRPQVAERSLWSVTIQRDTIGHQYWDKILWVIASYNHYKVTGDKNFLLQAYRCSANTMKELEQKTFDQTYGLFMGPSVFNDGIAGYPEPIYEPGNYSSYVLDYKNACKIKCLSTNCIYYGAYISLLQMSVLLKQDKSFKEYNKKAEDLKKNILKHFYNTGEGTFSYLIDQNGKADSSQEGLGISFAVLFDILSHEQAHQLIKKAVVSKYGITSITPDFPRFSPNKPGRHNNIIWPMVNGFFANAALNSGNDSIFSDELFHQTHLALDEDKGNYDFREVYNPYTGKPDGGYQCNGKEFPDYHWKSCRLQTWSATAYISMVLNGLFGLKPGTDKLTFYPYLPEEIQSIELKNLKYRGCLLQISVKGKGRSIKSFEVDGIRKSEHSIPVELKGTHSIYMEVE